MTDRDRFLTSVRERLTDGLPTNPLRPIQPGDGSTPPIDYNLDLTDPVSAFTAAASDAGAEVHDAGTDARRQALLARLRDDGMHTAVVSHDPEVAGIGPALTSVGLRQLPAGDRDAAARADLGITGARFGISLTGSLVVDSLRAGTRLVSLLPPTHLVLLDRRNLLPTPGALFRDLERHLPEGLPSNLVLITGHSRSADIELQLTPGVHGPRRVIIALIGPSDPAPCAGCTS